MTELLAEVVDRALTKVIVTVMIMSVMIVTLGASACAIATDDPANNATGSSDSSAEGSANEVEPAAASVTGSRVDPQPTTAPRADGGSALQRDATTEALSDALRPTPEPFSRPPAPNERTAPTVANSPAALAEQIIAAEQGLRDPDATPADLANSGHLQQVAYRKLGRSDFWAEQVLQLLPADIRVTAEQHLAARLALRGLSSGYDAATFVPAWEIIEPEPPAALLGYYIEAEGATGIEWEFLAAINLIETGMGRINGLSSAGAQGPMQFIPTTWDEVGEGDVNNPRDAIMAAARYLVRRGGPDDMAGALWGYNNSDRYVETVSTYAQLLRSDPAAFTGIYNWEIYFWSAAGDLWLPVGFRTEEPIELEDFLSESPWSAPDPNLGS